MTCPCFPRPIGRDLRGSPYTRFRHSELNCHVFQKKYLYICCPLIKITSGNLKSGVNFGNMLIYEDEKRENEISCLSIIFSVISSSEFGVLGNLLLLLRNKTVKILIPDTDANFFFTLRDGGTLGDRGEAGSLSRTDHKRLRRGLKPHTRPYSSGVRLMPSLRELCFSHFYSS